ncbi:MAG: DNA-binding response regulator [Anaerolineae bacterium]|nr:MAG: DNA-binding response regulator [Anaerolineae bacterium]
MNKIRILLVDDHALFREGIASVLNSQSDMEVVGEASDGLEAVVMARKLHPDVILMDVSMPGTNGLEATRQIKQDLPEARIVMLTVHDEDEKLFDAVRYGAQGYLLKTIRTAQLIEMIHAAYQGEAAINPLLASRILEEFRRLAPSETLSETGVSDELLTPREREVLTLVARGLIDREIARQLTVSVYTVKSHVRSILQKLHVATRHEAARLARQKSSKN